MNTHLALHAITATLRTAEKLGATVPKRITTEHARLSTLADSGKALYVQHDLPSAVVAALADGRDPSVDPEVQRQTVLQAVADSGPAVRTAIAARAQAFVTEHADALLESFRKPFDEAAAVLAEQATSGAPQPWGPAQVADQTITAVQQVWKTLAGPAKHLEVDPRYWPLTIADIAAASFIDDNLSSRRELRPWDLAAAGYPLSLATAATLADRVAAVYLEHERRQEEYVEAGENAVRRVYGFRGPLPAA